MSDTPEQTPSTGPSLRKKPAATVPAAAGRQSRLAGSRSTDAAKIPKPRTISLATYAVAVQVIFSLAFALASWGSTPQLTKLLLDGNAKAAKPEPLCSASVVQDCYDAAVQIHKFRVGITQTTIVVSVLIGLLVFMFRRGSGAGRWVYVVLSVIGTAIGFAGTPLQVTAIFTSLPKSLGVLETIAAAASIAAIALLMMPKSAMFFRAHKQAANPNAAVRPGLFGPRARPAASAGTAPTATPAAARPGFFSALLRPPPPRRAPAAAAPTDNPSAGRVKAKVRASDAALPRDTEPARPRGKAKSRKS